MDGTGRQRKFVPKREEKLNSAVPQEILPSNGESCESLTVKILHPNIIVHLDSFFDISLVHLIRDLKSPSPWASFAAGNVPMEFASRRIFSIHRLIQTTRPERCECQVIIRCRIYLNSLFLKYKSKLTSRILEDFKKTNLGGSRISLY